MDQVCRKECLTRADWYIQRIEDLMRFMQERPKLDGDDVEQCQSMLREILARFRSDRRPAPPGQVMSHMARTFLWNIADAGDKLRISASSRPTVRWRDDLVSCRECLVEYVDKLALS